MKSHEPRSFPRPASLSDLDIAMFQTLVEGLKAEYLNLLPAARRLRQKHDAMLDCTTEIQARAVGLMVATGMDQVEALDTVDTWSVDEPPY